MPEFAEFLNRSCSEKDVRNGRPISRAALPKLLMNYGQPTPVAAVPLLDGVPVTDVDEHAGLVVGVVDSAPGFVRKLGWVD